VVMHRYDPRASYMGLIIDTDVSPWISWVDELLVSLGEEEAWSWEQSEYCAASRKTTVLQSQTSLYCYIK
jgi:hypothetical protein